MAVLAVLSVLYPIAVYSGRGMLSPLVFVALALFLVGLRVVTLRSEHARLWRLPLLGAGALLVVLAANDGWLAAKSYPVVLSLAAAFAFGKSLFFPPSLIERIARIHEPSLPPEGQAYCRIVTVVWTVWLLANALIAALLAVSGNEEVWVLWTGLIAYVVMGVLFGGEMLLRRWLRQRSAAA